MVLFTEQTVETTCRTVSIEAIKQCVELIPENPHNKLIQDIFADIQKMNASMLITLEQNQHSSTNLRPIKVNHLLLYPIQKLCV